MRLDLGAGDFPIDGYLTVDAYGPGQVKAKLQALPFADESASEIRLSHVLEHVPQADVAPVLDECRRVMRTGARMYVEVPDLDGIARWWCDTPVEGRGRLLMFFYGNQARDGEYHLTGFNAHLLADALHGAGFTCSEIWGLESHAAPAVAAKAVKP